MGYGRPSACVWFIGIEEGLGNTDSDDAFEESKGARWVQ